MNRELERIWHQDVLPRLDIARRWTRHALAVAEARTLAAARRFTAIWGTVVGLLSGSIGRFLPGLKARPRTLPAAAGWTYLAVAVVLGGVLLYGCSDRGDDPSPTTRRTLSASTPVSATSSADPAAAIQTPSLAEPAAPATVTAYRIPLSENEAVDPYDAILTLRDQIRRDTEDLFQRLARQLPPSDAAYLAGLWRIHSPEQFLRELASWLREGRNADLVPAEQRGDLVQLQQQCARYERLIADLPNTPTDPVSVVK